MNREILFKAKRKDNGEWVEGYVVAYPSGKAEIHKISKELPDILLICEIDPDTICQYTGLCDQNGKMIWENDILRFKDEVWKSSYCGAECNSWEEVENYGVIGFCNDTARYDLVRYKYNKNSVETDLHDAPDIEFIEFIEAHEVIGNIFDNPYLLEVE